MEVQSRVASVVVKREGRRVGRTKEESKREVSQVGNESGGPFSRLRPGWNRSKQLTKTSANMRLFRPFGLGSLKSCSRVRACSQEAAQEGTGTSP